MRVPRGDRLVFDTWLLLATRLPAPRPVRLRLLRRHPCAATTEKDAEGFLVCIRRDAMQRMLDSLAHEWGHVRAWGRGRDHGDRWGVEYAKAYRIVIGED